MKNIKSSQTSISVISCTEFNKTQFFPVSIVKDKEIKIPQSFTEGVNYSMQDIDHSPKQFGMSMSWAVYNHKSSTEPIEHINCSISIYTHKKTPVVFRTF